MAPRSDPNDKAANYANDDGRNDEDEDDVGDEVVAVGEDAMSAEDLAEIARVNRHLDSLNSALDAIEQRNDDIHSQLLDLLQSNREIRQSLHDEAMDGRSVAADAADKSPSGDDAEPQEPQPAAEG